MEETIPNNDPYKSGMYTFLSAFSKPPVRQGGMENPVKDHSLPSSFIAPHSVARKLLFGAWYVPSSWRIISIWVWSLHPTPVHSHPEFRAASSTSKYSNVFPFASQMNSTCSKMFQTPSVKHIYNDIINKRKHKTQNVFPLQSTCSTSHSLHHQPLHPLHRASKHSSACRTAA